jgi:hypothetical protein
VSAAGHGTLGRVSLSGHEPISPELVLVMSPQDAARARELLPEPTLWRPPDRRRSVFVEAAAPEPSVVDISTLRTRQPLPFIRPDEDARVPPAVPRRRRTIRRVAASAVVFVVGMGAGLVAGVLLGHSDEPSSLRSSLAGALQSSPTTMSSATRPQVAPATRTISTPQAPKGKNRPPKSSTKRTTTTRRATAPAPKPATPKPATPKPAAAKPATANHPSGFVPARVWLWTPRPSAHAYVVSLVFNGRRVLRVRTSKARLVLPPSFRFHAGRYHWLVVSEPEATTPVVDLTFVLSAAAAADAAPATETPPGR